MRLVVKPMSKSSLYLDKTLNERVVRGVRGEDGRGGGYAYFQQALIRPTC